MSSVTFTRESDGQSFTFTTHPPYELHPDTLLPSAQTLDVSSIEYMGRAGGRTLASRFQKATVKIAYNVREWYADSRSIMELISAASAFFNPMQSDLTANLFTMTVTTDDRNGSQYLMRHGAITMPFSAPLQRGRGISLANEMDFVFDDPLRYWVSGDGVVSGRITPAAAAGVEIGQEWVDGVQQFTGGLSMFVYPASGAAGTPQTINVVSSTPVNVSIKIFGRITNPVVVNDTDGSRWEWPGTIPVGNAMSVDDLGVTTAWDGRVRYNAVGQLTAQPGLNTFELSGVNLGSKTAQWTGTPNASPSRLLDGGGNVIATNSHTDPNATKQYGLWNCTASSVDGKWKYTSSSNSSSAVSGIFSTSLPVGTIIYYKLSADTTTRITLENASLLKQNDSGECWWTISATGNHAIFLVFNQPGVSGIGQSTTLERFGQYAPSDYAAMQEAGVTWFDGDSVFSTDVYAEVTVRGAF